MKYSQTAPVIAYIGLGSNLAQPVAQIKSARTAIASIVGVQELAFSSLLHSLPMGPQDQPDYVNAVYVCRNRLIADGFVTLSAKHRK